MVHDLDLPIAIHKGQWSCEIRTYPEKKEANRVQMGIHCGVQGRWNHGTVERYKAKLVAKGYTQT